MLHHQDEVLSDSPVADKKIIKTNEIEIFSEDQESKPLEKNSERLSKRYDVSKSGDWFFQKTFKRIEKFTGSSLD